MHPARAATLRIAMERRRLRGHARPRIHALLRVPPRPPIGAGPPSEDTARAAGVVTSAHRGGMMLGRQRTRQHHVLRTAVIFFEVVGPLHARGLNMLLLNRRRRQVRLMHHHAFFGTWIVANATRAAFVGHPPVIVDRPLVHYGLVDVGVVNDGPVHVHHRGVVRELAAAPLATHKADPHIPEAVVDTTVVAHVVAPVPGMKYIKVAVPAPVGRRPEGAFIGGGNPRTGHPVIAIVPIRPIAGHPHQAGLRARRLNIHWQNRRSKTDTDEHARIRRGGNGRKQRGQQ